MAFLKMAVTDSDRFRSFAERYVIARAETWPAGDEERRSWEALLQAKSLYKRIAAMGNGVAVELQPKGGKDADRLY